MKRTTRKLTTEHRQKISEAKRGKPFTQEHKTKISEALTKYWETIPTE